MPRPLHACAVLPLSALVLALALPAAPAQSQIRRCVTADGTHLYTDRACADVDASERLPRPEDGGASSAPIRRDCSRRLQDLVFELTAAIDSRDVNRLAGVYHWPGTSSRSGDAIMSRLDAIVNRPLVDITPVHPSPPEPPPLAPAPPPVQASSSTRTWRTPARPGTTAPAVASGPPGAAPALPGIGPEAGDAAATGREPAVDPHGPARRPPTGLVLDQTAANQVTPLQTVFSLRRHLGCWWVSL